MKRKAILMLMLFCSGFAFGLDSDSTTSVNNKIKGAEAAARCAKSAKIPPYLNSCIYYQVCYKKLRKSGPCCACCEATAFGGKNNGFISFWFTNFRDDTLTHYMDYTNCPIGPASN